MKFIVSSHDGERVLCQFADMAPMQWLDARVAEAIGYSYAIRFETRAGANRCAFIHNGAAVALGDWDHDRETLGTSSGRCTCGLRASQRLGGGEQRPRGLGEGAGRGGPARRVQTDGSRGADVRPARALRVVARLPEAVASDWRARQHDARLAAAAEWETTAHWFPPPGREAAR